MPYLLNVLYLALLVVASPRLIYRAARQGKYREGWGAKLLGRVPRRTGDRPCFWLHAVSVGEANLLQTLLPRIERRYPDVQCVISVTTKAAYDLARQRFAPRTVFYCPLDFSWAVAEALSRIRPQALILAELELWPNLIRAAQRRGVRVALINGRLSERSYRGYRRVRRLISRTLQSIDLVAAQNDQYASRFRQLGARAASVHVTGSLKFDGAQTDRNNPATRKLAALAGLKPSDVVFLAGSTQAPEEALALRAYLDLKTDYPHLRLILVPRHPERFDEVARLLDRGGVCWQRRSRLPTEGPDPRARILLVDTIGELGAWWGTAHIAYVGGSMGRRGGQNMIEPAAYGAAVSFGPCTQNFRDVVALMRAHDAAHVVRDGVQMQAFVRRCLQDEPFAAALGRNAARLVRSQQGAADRTVHLLGMLLGQRAAAAHDQPSAA